MKYYLCLGANMEEPKQQIENAIQLISSEANISLLRKSSLIVSKPYGVTEQADFYNQVIEISSSLPPRELLCRLLSIETSIGRIRRTKWGARLIDIDILLAENTVLDTTKACSEEQLALPELIIPHPDFHNRLFALQLLNELIPEMLHPTMQKSISELYYQLSNGGKP